MLALEEDRVERLRVEVGVERLAVGADLAVHRPGVDEVGVLDQCVARVDVVVLGRHHHVVRRRLRVLPGPVVQQLGDVARDVRASGDGQRAAFAEVVLHVDHDQRLLHAWRLLTGRAAWRSVAVSMTGSPLESWRATSGSSARERRCRSRAVLQRLAPDHLALADERHEQRAVVAVVLRRLADPDHLGLGDAVGGEAAQGVLAAADRDLVLALLGDADELAVVESSRATSL